MLLHHVDVLELALDFEYAFLDLGFDINYLLPLLIGHLRSLGRRWLRAGGILERLLQLILLQKRCHVSAVLRWWRGTDCISGVLSALPALFLQEFIVLFIALSGHFVSSCVLHMAEQFAAEYFIAVECLVEVSVSLRPTHLSIALSRLR